MKAIFLAIAFALPITPVLHAQANPGCSFREVFASVLTEVNAKTRIPVFLPAELPKPFCDARNAMVEKATPDEYAVGLYYDLGKGNAGFAASFAGKDNPPYSPRELANVREVKLSGGIVGLFRPVSCGGSCAPANLWWRRKGLLYQVQLKLPATLSNEEQKRIITAIANSAIMASPR